MRCVRIWFAKEGKVKYISHLDVMRCMSRAVRRAGILSDAGISPMMGTVVSFSTSERSSILYLSSSMI